MSSERITAEMVRATFESSPTWVPAATLRSWVEMQDLAILDVIFEYITRSEHRGKIDPLFSIEEREAVLFSYYEQCFVADRAFSTGMLRRTVAYYIVDWFNPDGGTLTIADLSFHVKVKRWLGEMYCRVPAALRPMIVHWILVPLLARARWQEFFGDWAHDTTLNEPYSQAIAWASALYTYDPIPLETIKAWMQDTAPEAVEDTFRLLITTGCRQKICPPLDPALLEGYLFPHLAPHFGHGKSESACFDKPQIGSLLSGCLASLVPTDCPSEQRFISDLKQWLAETYRNSDEETRAWIAFTVLAPAVAKPEVAEFYQDWREDPVLAKAYQQAAEWANAQTGTDPIPLELLRAWMYGPAAEAQGAAYYLLLGPENSERIDPPLPLEELENFVLAYYERCLRDDIEGQGCALSRYDAASEIVGWFDGMDCSRAFMLRLRDLLASVYISSDEEIQEAIVCGSLEHIFENPENWPLFEDWKNDPSLSKAYGEAMRRAQSRG